MKVSYTPEGAYRVDFVDDWWRDNRPASPELFREELAEAIDQLRAMPKSGTHYATKQDMVIYRVLLEDTRQWLYYSFDLEEHWLTIHSVWGTRRGRPPKL